MMAQCGCYIDTLYLEADPSNTQTIIVYCPLHAAAYQTLAALQALADIVDNLAQDEYVPDSFTTQAARAAIAAATAEQQPVYQKGAHITTE